MLSLLTGAAPGDLMLVGAGGGGGTPALTISCAGTASTSSTVACSGTYTGSAPSSFATAVWQAPCSGSVTPPAATFTGGAWGPVNFPTPSGACTGALTITTNLSTSATSGSVVVSGAAFWTLVNHTLIPGGIGGPGHTAPVSGAISTVGATIIVIPTQFYCCNGFTPTITDSLSNTWTALTVQTGASSKTLIYYSLNPTTGASHTFTLGANLAGSGAFFGTGQVMAFSGSATPVLDNQSGTNAATNTIQPGSLTCSQSNCLYVTGFGTGYNGTDSVSVPFAQTFDQQAQGANSLGGAGSWYSQGTAAAVNPTWSVTGTASPNDATAAMMVIHP